MKDNYPFLLPENWLSTGDGFSMYALPLADILNSFGVYDTGISKANPADVQSYYDDWYLYCIQDAEETWSLLKMREQEYDYVPGFSDKDDPSVTVSFVSFPMKALSAIADPETRTPETMEAFVAAFRRTTEYLRLSHSPALQRYFSMAKAKAPYLIAEAYIRKLLDLSDHGVIPFPTRMKEVPDRIVEGIIYIERESESLICDWTDRCLRIADPANPTLPEKQAILAVHTGNLSFNSFAAEVKFHADALVQWEKDIPVVGQAMWYNSAIRADMQMENDSWLRKTFFSPYYQPDSALVLEQEAIHGKR